MHQIMAESSPNISVNLTFKCLSNRLHILIGLVKTEPFVK